jgi:hypothetical protein
VENSDDFGDRIILLCKSGETGSKLRWGPRPDRVRRHRLVIDQPGLKVFLLRPQLAAAMDGTQLAAECPDRRARSCESRASRVHPGVA